MMTAHDSFRPSRYFADKIQANFTSFRQSSDRKEKIKQNIITCITSDTWHKTSTRNICLQGRLFTARGYDTVVELYIILVMVFNFIYLSGRNNFHC